MAGRTACYAFVTRTAEHFPAIEVMFASWSSLRDVTLPLRLGTN